MAKKKTIPKKTSTLNNDDIPHDYSLMNNLQNHMQVYGFASAIDNVVAACEDKLIQWNQRLAKAKKLRKTLGENYGRN